MLLNENNKLIESREELTDFLNDDCLSLENLKEEIRIIEETERKDNEEKEKMKSMIKVKEVKHDNELTSFSFSPDGKLLATGSADSTA